MRTGCLRVPMLRLLLGAPVFLACLSLASPACQKRDRSAPTRSEPGVGAEAESLGQLRVLWRLPGFEATHSLLSANPPGPVFLAAKRTGVHAWDLCAIDVHRGQVKWCSPLERRAGISVTVVGEKAIVHDVRGKVTGHDLATGRRAWATQVDCEIPAGRLGAVGSGVALGRCESKESAWSQRHDLVALEVETGQVRWRTPRSTSYGEVYRDGPRLISRTTDLDAFRLDRPIGEIWGRRKKGDARAPVGDQRSAWVVLDAGTGTTLPAAALGRLARGTPDDDAIQTFAAESPFSGEVAFFTQDLDGAKPLLPTHDHTCTRFSAGCIGTSLHAFNLVKREGRVFELGCDSISEIDPATGTDLTAWPLTRGRSFVEPAVVALEAEGKRLTVVLASYDDREVGRVVTFNGGRRTVFARVPGLDPKLAGLMEGVLVVQASLPSAPSDRPWFGDQAEDDGSKALVGYSVSEGNSEPVSGERLDRERVRDLIAGRGGFDRIACEQWGLHFDTQSLPSLKAIPRWEEHLAALMDDRDPKVHESAFAAAFHLRSAPLIQALLRRIAPVHEVGSNALLGSEEASWWSTVRERHDQTRGEATMVLMKMQYAPAIEPLARIFLEPHPPLVVGPNQCSSFVGAFCSWITQSTQPEAKAAIAAYDRAMEAPGAWDARCSWRY